MRRLGQVVAVAAVVFTPALAHAQLPWRIQSAQGQRSTTGLCRIWVDGAPANRQPAPTNCAYAQSHVPRNGRVVYVNQTNDRNRGIFTSNERVVNVNGRRCVQRLDRFGHRQTVCADGDHDWDDRVVARAERERNRQRDLDDRRWKNKKDKHHDDWRGYEHHDNGLHRGQERRAHSRH